MKTIACVLATLTVALIAVPNRAEAFCGFYVSGADAKLFNNATQVVMMRQGTRTVLSMANNYQGPPSDFAMVIPVPVVLQEDNVKTLPASIFTRIDSLAAPRLVEYWEQDPCMKAYPDKRRMRGGAPPMPSAAAESSKSDDLGVTVEASFNVGEYQIVILSAKEATGLDTWLRQEKYKIPEGADAFLRPYVQSGSKFFVAKVDAKKVTFKDNMAQLSPLRFFYDSEEFSLPVRLGLMNAKGKQDLLVHILAPNQRYEVANYPNVTIPTNIDVVEDARNRFGEFYTALYDRTIEKTPGAVVTEYSWDSASCDPCPTPPLSQSELATLGADVLDVPMPVAKPKPTQKKKTPPKDAVDELTAPKSKGARMRRMPPRPPMPYRRFVLTRLHARYDAASMKEDLVFKAAKGIVGGREMRTGPNNTLENGSTTSGMNNFQARYAIRHAWTGKIDCSDPVRGRWGGPPAGVDRTNNKPTPALNLAFAPRTAKLASMVKQDVPEIGVKPTGAGSGAKPATDKPADKPATDNKGETKKKEESKGCRVGNGGDAPIAISLLLLGLLVARRRRS